MSDFKILKDGEELSRLSLANMPNNAFGDAKYLYTIGKVEDSIEITFEGHTKLKEYTASAVVNDFEDYKNTENGQEKTEQGFIEYISTKDLVQTKAEIKNKFRSYLYNSILENDENKWKPLVSTGNRGSKEQPITLDMLTKSIFAHFLYTEPLQDNILSEKYKRDVESENIVRLMNLFFEKTLVNWNPSASQNDTEQIKLSRMFSSKSIMAWSELFKDAISAKKEMHN
mgnify:CR=1 FL=1